jgi:hypothetical protein
MKGLNDFRIFALWVGMAEPMMGFECGAGPETSRKNYVKGWLGVPSTVALPPASRLDRGVVGRQPLSVFSCALVLGTEPVRMDSSSERVPMGRCMFGPPQIIAGILSFARG